MQREINTFDAHLIRPSKKTRAIVLPSICLAYILFRFWDLTASCLWFDEIFSVHAAEHSWNALFSFVAQDLIHPPLFYVLLKFWIGFGGETLFWLRLFPVFFSILGLFPFLMICKELKLKLLTVAVGLSFFAINGALIKYAQEVRMYSLLLCLSLFSIWFFTRFFIKGKSFAALVIVNILLVYTHYFGWFVVFSEIIAIVVIQRIKILQTLLMLGITFAAFVPWIIFIVKTAGGGADIQQNIGWMVRPGFSGVFEFVFDTVEPFYFQQSSSQPSSLPYISIPLLLLIAAAKILYLADWKKETERNGFYLLSIFTAVPILLAFFGSWILPVSIWGSRHLIIVFVPMSILAAMFLTSIKIKPLKIALISLVFLLSAAAFIVRINTPEPHFIWCAWENFAAELRIKEKDSHEPVNIYTFEDLVAYHFWFSLRNSDKFKVNVVKGIDGLTEDTAYFLPRGFDGVKTTGENDFEGESFWIAFRAGKLDLLSPPLSNLISKGYKLGESTIFEMGNQKALLVEIRKTERGRSSQDLFNR